ncbi:unnamed protein product [Phaedon cochleariae]|uniref:CHK kinase-like domain-containing protein n=1 Tax=Phaedon cochleariae TaxID=80249 RepID=A0A9P0DAU6_PHACE|nr:unnamed protein product [Phaedon cochleariae]
MEKHENSDILSWIEQSVEHEHFVKQEIVLTGTTGKTEGYSGDIVFAKVIGVDTVGNNREVDLAIKIATQNKILREQLSNLMEECYQREIYVYEKIFPAFEKFQEERKIIDRFNAVPKCYRTFLSEVIVLENLRTQGYKLHNKGIPMNLQHIELVLSNYAKLHALSFAFRDQKAEEYNILTSSYYRHSIQMIEQISEIFKNAKSNVVKHLNEVSRMDLAEKYKEVLENNSILDILKDEVEHVVITHGDCHNNNFIFQYEEDDERNPTKVAILDWQISIQHSPVMDVSYFLYAVAGENLYKLPDLLKFYHSRLTNHAKEMGTDLRTIYPFTSLIEDWRKYSFYGFAFITAFLEISFVTEEETPNLDDIKDFTQMFCDRKIENRDEYLKRLIEIVDQYCNHQI